MLACILAIASQTPNQPIVWRPYEAGYQTEGQPRNGHPVMRCTATDTTHKYGAAATIRLHQSNPKPVAISGWSKASAVGGIEDSDYSIYADIRYSDGTWEYGAARGFATGDHGWQLRSLTFSPRQPIDTINLYALFRNHSGTVLFSDFQASELDGKDLFDGQPTQWIGPDVPSKGGLFVRDLTDPAKVWPLNALSGNSPELKLKWNAMRLGPNTGCQLVDLSGKDRALTFYFAVPFDAIGGLWYRDIRHQQTIETGSEYSNFVNVPVGVVGAISLYPYACVTNSTGGIVIGTPLAPSVCRLFYNSTQKLLVGAYDVAFSKEPGHNIVSVGVWTDKLTPAEKDWGFRAATQKYYGRVAGDIGRHTEHFGIWIPFTDPSKIENPRDFGISYHEGDNSVASDHKMGIESYRYSEPNSFWMPMAKSEPRTYENALRILHERAKNGPQRDQAQAAETCALRGPDGRLQLEFRNEPWCDGALFVLDPTPGLAKGALEQKDIQWSGSRPDSPDGEYLDSLEAWGDHLDYDPAHWNGFQLTFDADGRPVVPEWFYTFALEQTLAQTLHNQIRLIMANTVPVRFSALTANLDVMGIETNWLGADGSWRPDSDETFNLRRVLAFQRPYVLLQNTDFKRFGPEQVEKYFERCAFYDIYPSMFSADAATNPYSEDPALYNRDRAKFKEWIPIIRRLSGDAWEPITYDPKVYVERYGDHFWTFFNDSTEPRTCNVTIDNDPMQLPPSGTLWDRHGHPVKVKNGKAVLTIGPEQCEIWTVKW